MTPEASERKHSPYHVYGWSIWDANEYFVAQCRDAETANDFCKSVNQHEALLAVAEAANNFLNEEKWVGGIGGEKVHIQEQILREALATLTAVQSKGVQGE